MSVLMTKWLERPERREKRERKWRMTKLERASCRLDDLPAPVCHVSLNWTTLFASARDCRTLARLHPSLSLSFSLSLSLLPRQLLHKHFALSRPDELSTRFPSPSTAPPTQTDVIRGIKVRDTDRSLTSLTIGQRARVIVPRDREWNIYITRDAFQDGSLRFAISRRRERFYEFGWRLSSYFRRRAIFLDVSFLALGIESLQSRESTRIKLISAVTTTFVDKEIMDEN